MRVRRVRQVRILLHPLHLLHPVHSLHMPMSASRIASADRKATFARGWRTTCPYFAGQSNVLDVGCGRGEFLDLLRDTGIAAKGLDLNPEMVEVCKARGLDATTADARSYLQGLAG